MDQTLEEVPGEACTAEASGSFRRAKNGVGRCARMGSLRS